jgi:hypothetical protein
MSLMTLLKKLMTIIKMQFLQTLHLVLVARGFTVVLDLTNMAIQSYCLIYLAQSTLLKLI